MEEQQVSELREELARLNRRVSALEVILRERLGVKESPEPVPAGPAPVAIPAPAAADLGMAPPSPAAPRARARPVDGTRLEAEIGGNWLNKIGALAFVLGVAFFLKYAFENRWIDETGRIVIGILGGIACLYLGEHFHKKGFPKYAQGVSGAGIAILYFTIYAAFSFYQLMDQTPAFGFMVLVTATTVALAVRHDSIGIAILGIIGGFLTPVLLNRPEPGGSNSQIQLFTYLAILDLGILALTYYKDWRALNVLSLAGTALVFAGWAAQSYEPAKLGRTIIFLTIFYGIFAAQSFVQNVTARRALNAADLFLVIATPVLYFGASYALLSSEYHIYLGMLAAAMAAVYVILARQVNIVAFEDKRLRLLFLAVGAGFLITAVPIQLEKEWVAIGWAGEGVVLASIGFYLSSSRMRYVGIGLLGLAAARLLTVETPSTYAQPAVPFANERFATFLFVIAAIVVTVWLYHRNREQTERSEAALPAVLILGANVLMVWALSVEALDWTRRGHPPYQPTGAESLALSAVWAVYGALMVTAGIVWRHRATRLMGVVLLGIVILKSFLVDVWTLERVYRIIAFLGLGALLLIASYIYQAYRDRIRQFVTGEEE